MGSRDEARLRLRVAITLHFKPAVRTALVSRLRADKTTPMKTNTAFVAAIIATISTLTLRADHAPRAVLPDAVVDLRTVEGAARVNGQWRS